MKRIVAAIIPLFLIIITVVVCWTLPASAHPEVKVVLNNQPVKMDVLPVIEDGRTLVPVRAIVEAMGADVGWDKTQRKVTITLGQDEIILYIDKTSTYVNGKAVTLDVPARIKNDRTLIPLRFVSENFGATVAWDKTTYTVSITTSGIITPTTDTDAVKAEIISNITSARKNAGVSAPIVISKLSTMARAHSLDMLAKKRVSNNLSYGTTAKRAGVYGVSTPAEFVAGQIPFGDKIAESWLNGDNGELLTSAENVFIGVGVAASSGNTGNVYATLEIIKGSAFFTNIPGSAATNSITLKGYTLSNSTPICVYKLTGNNSGKYTSRKTYTISAIGADKSFSQSVTLWGAGYYLVSIDQSSFILKCTAE